MTGEAGSVSIIMAVIVGLLAVVAAGLGGSAQIVSAQSRAQTAADAAALAAAPVTFRPFGSTGSPVAEAGRFAAANGAQLVECWGCELDPSWARRVVEVEVQVEIDVLGVGRTAVSAVAAAEFVPIQLLAPVAVREVAMMK